MWFILSVRCYCFCNSDTKKVCKGIFWTENEFYAFEYILHLTVLPSICQVAISETKENTEQKRKNWEWNKTVKMADEGERRRVGENSRALFQGDRQDKCNVLKLWRGAEDKREEQEEKNSCQKIKWIKRCLLCIEMYYIYKAN